MKKKTFEFSLPEFHLKSFLSLKCALFFTLITFLFGFFYWAKKIYPYYHIKQAVVYAPIREIKSSEIGSLADGSLSEGDLFQKGELLFSLNAMIDSSEIGQLDGKISAMKPKLEQANGKAEQIMDQYLYLKKELGGVESAAVLEEILAEVQVWQAKSLEISQAIAGLTEQRDSIVERLSKLSSLAPFEGVVLRRFSEPGEKISLGDPVLLVGQKNLSIEAEIPETMLSYLSLKQKATIHLPSFPEKIWEGHISWISPSVSNGRLKIRIHAEDLPFKTGLTADVCIKIR